MTISLAAQAPLHRACAVVLAVAVFAGGHRLAPPLLGLASSSSWFVAERRGKGSGDLGAWGSHSQSQILAMSRGGLWGGKKLWVDQIENVPQCGLLQMGPENGSHCETKT